MMSGKNIGELLTAGGISWGGFMGGFDLTATNANGSTGCTRATHSSIVGADIPDYIAHHNWFAYYLATANPGHARPSSIAAIGSTLEADGTTPDPANHEYDLNDFYAALKAGNFPAVSYLKMPAYQDGHAGYSDPLDEQSGVVTAVNVIEHQPDWKNTAIIILYDDSDGWYDHAAAKPTSASYDTEADQLDGAGVCGNGVAPNGVGGKPVNGRCGPGTRIPFIVISPYAKPNAVLHDRISQASVPKFIEDNWLHGERLGGGSFDASAGSIVPLFDFTSPARTAPLFLDPATGNPLR
jgi:phospholipase C